MAITGYNTTYCDDVNIPDENGKTPLDKNYMRILFKPGIAVQTRELNQLQSLIQAQLDRVGESIFRSGKPVIDGISRFDDTKKIYSVDLQILKSAVDVSQLGVYNYITRNVNGGSDTSLQAKISKIIKTSEDSVYIYCRAYVKNTNSETSNGLNLFKYVVGDTVSLSDVSDNTVDTFLAQVVSVNTAVGAHIAKGVYFVKGSYVIVDEQYIVNDLSLDSTFTGYVALKITEGTVSSNDDQTLLDNADGYLNYNSPGADRYYINLDLVMVTDDVQSNDNYITLLKIENDRIIIDNSTSAAAGIDDKLAQRTFEESGNYVVNPFPISLREAYNDLSNGGLYKESELADNGFGNADGSPDITTASKNLVCMLDPSVAYVKGHRIELKNSIPLVLPKARTTASVENAAVSASMGMYIEGDFDEGSELPNIDNAATEYELLNASDEVIGSTKIRSIEYTGAAYRLFLYDIKINEPAVGDPVPTIEAGVKVSLNDFTFVSSSVLKNRDVQTALYKLPLSPIKNIANLRITKKQRFTNTASSNIVSFVINDTSSSFDKSPSNIIVYCDGAIITSYDVSETAANVLTLSSNSFANKQVVVIASVTTNATRGVKTLKNITVTPDEIDESGIYELPGVYHLAAAPSGYTIVNDGQNGVHYSVAKVKPNEGVTVGSITVSHYEFTVYGDYYDALSYKTVNGALSSIPLDLEDIPYYQDTPLYDVLDFRYASGGVSYSVLDPYEAITFDVEYYLPRTDSLIVNQTGNFSIIQGLPSINPKKPAIPDSAMELYTLNLAPYTFGPGDVNVKKIDNQRYTMNNIRQLDRRISNLEYYTTLSLLEKTAKDTGIYDDLGEDRFKNGFVVDNFSGHNVGDPKNPEYICAVDPQRNECRPAFSIVDLKLEVTSSSDLDPNSTFTKSGVHDRSLTLPYSEIPYITQSYASGDDSVNPFNVSSYVGKLNLYPASDYWCDTVQRPDLVVKDNTLKDAIRNFAEDLEDSLAEDGYDIQILGTEWNSWETYWRGRPTIELSSTYGAWYGRGYGPAYVISQEVSQARDGINTSIGTSSTSEINLGDRVIDITVRPYIRQRYVYFSAQSLKPNTIYYPFFDGVNVSEYCYKRDEIDKKSSIASINGSPIPYVDPAGEDQVLKTDSNGSLSGLFVIPNSEDGLRFLTGTRQFKLIDSPKNVASDSTSYAAADYVAAGTVKTTQGTILSTSIPELVRTPVSESRTTTSQFIIGKKKTCWVDPIAQSFLIGNPEGIFASSVDLYFSSKSSSGATVEIFIVTCENGIPTQNVVPLSTVIKTADEVNTSELGTISTSFEFEQPIYLSPSQEYALVCVSSDDDYRVYTATLGSNDLITNKVISTNPYNGVFFKSQNSSTWTPDQSKDLKFVLNRAKFNNNVPLSVVSQTLSLSRVEKINVTDGGSGYTSAPIVTITGGGGTGATAISEISGGEVVSVRITNPGDGYTSAPIVSIGGPGEGATAVAILNNVQVSSFVLDQDNLELSVSDQTNPEITHKAYVSNQISVLGRTYSVEPNVTYNSVVKQSWSNTAAAVNCNSPVVLTTTLQSTSDYITPVVDIERMNVKLIRNRCMADNAQKTSRYITRTVNLAEAADQIDIYFDINRPSVSASVNVYVSRDGEDWTSVAIKYPSVVPVNSNEYSFSEVHYSLNDEDVQFSSFKVKVEFISTNIVDVPRIKNLRAIATC